jgi:hypothetical protein
MMLPSMVLRKVPSARALPVALDQIEERTHAFSGSAEIVPKNRGNPTLEHGDIQGDSHAGGWRVGAWE